MPPTIIGLGEILWDLFPTGPRFGGAPANFACHAATLGAKSYIVSALGDDELGRSALAALQSHNVIIDHVASDPEHPTGTVDVRIDSQGKATYQFAADTAWDRLPWSDTLQALATQSDVVCFGTLGQRSPQSSDTIQRFVASTPTNSLRLFDINLRPPFYNEQVIRTSLQLANALKLNDDELPLVATMLGLSGSDSELLAQFAQMFDLRWIALTRGPEGAALLYDGQLYDSPGQQVTVVDTVGAGDAFTAALVTSLLRKATPSAALAHAINVASYVCTQPGATPTLPPHLLTPTRNH